MYTMKMLIMYTNEVFSYTKSSCTQKESSYIPIEYLCTQVQCFCTRIEINLSDDK